MHHFLRNLVFIAFAVTVLTAPSLADIPDAKDQPFWWIDRMSEFVTQMSAKMSELLSSGVLREHVRILIVAGDVFLIVHLIVAWMRKRIDAGLFVHIMFIAMIVEAVFQNYVPVCRTVFGYVDDLGSAAQSALLGSDSIFASYEHLTKLFAKFYFEDFSLSKLNLAYLSMAIWFYFISGLLTTLAFFVSIWSVLGYFVALPLGLLVLPTMLHHQVSFMFEGWMRLFLNFCLYGLIGKIVMSVLVLFMDQMFQFHVANTSKTFLLGVDSGPILLISTIGAAMMLCIPLFVSAITQTAFQGMGGGVKALAGAATRAAAA